jgi:predicted component of type VI protein secretion system
MNLARLVPVDGGEPIELSRDVTIVGRKDECDVAIDHKSISKQHCALVKTDGLIFVRDLGSTNGTRVNGQRVRRAALVPNDEIAFAAIKYRVAFGELAPTPHAETQAMDAGELADYVKAAEMPEPETPVPVPPKIEVHLQDLPDVYADESKKP